MKPSGKPWKIALPFAGFLALCLIWSGYWFWLSTTTRAAMQEWRSEQARQGMALDCANESWGGFPFRIEVRCSPGRVTRAGQSVTFTKLTIMAQAYRLRHLLILNDGDTILADGARETTIRHEGAIASLILRKDGDLQADAQITAIEADGISAAKLNLHIRRQADVLDLSIGIADAQAGILPGEPVTMAHLLLNANASPAPAILDTRAIAAMGTRFTLTQAELHTGQTRFVGSGNFGIMSDGRADGAMSGRLTNLDHLLEELARRGLITPEARLGAGALLGLLGGNGQDGIKIDIAARQGELWLGPFRLGELPRLF